MSLGRMQGVGRQFMHLTRETSKMDCFRYALGKMTTSPHNPTFLLIFKDRNDRHLVQISRIDGHRLV